ncbi:P-loop containing nucleoside triphosphate hydrolase [Cordyceps javanica]|uniref:P-loop containing nucleoside triphosphate hydrolase n=1 Tax=Cordyceps javanica TaxID=43265 RepID=A0A545VFS9_9HYPO|nr:P-loop containing nucleoside triphosphate hydrolase [Cordyceps javanica]TQW11758.1 P-loop containing nucleoside triphosphate hydrolase [Cordyceps javanica]
MDALAALSLASTLMQFSDYGSKLLSRSPSLYRPARGALADSIDVQVLVQDLVSLEQSLKRQAPSRSAIVVGHVSNKENAAALEVLYARCLGGAQNLLAHLARLRPRTESTTNQHNPRKNALSERWRSVLGADGLEALDRQQQPGLMQFQTWAGFHNAFRATWEGREMETLEDTIWEIRRDAQFRVLVSFRDALSYLASQRPQTSRELKRFTSRILDSFYNSEEAFILQIQTQSRRLLQLDESGRDTDGDDDPLGISATDILHSIGSLQTPDQSKSRKISRLTNSRLENELRSLAVETCILTSLSFAAMADRRESVEKAHARTFNWIYKDAENARVPWSNFVDWLRHGDGIYWINGMVGCGKSTLMRYLYENKTTQQELELWAGGQPCEVYSFFFWNSGAEDQKTQLGLLRSLLFDMLQRHRNLMRQVMPDAWEAWSARAEAALEDMIPYDSPLLPPEPESFTVPALREVFQRVLEAVGKTTKLCFFIDGLDEYGAEHSDIISLTTQCAALPNVKFCLSSRPLRVFEEAFVGLPTLRLQDLTHDDLCHYVLDCLYSQPRMHQLSHPQNSVVSRLIQETVAKSQGVFLWVKLVVRSLVHSLPACDGIAELQRQVHQLPADIDDLFAHMVAQKDHAHASRILQVFQAARKRSPEKITLLRLSFADDEDELLAEEAPMQKITIDEVGFRCREMDSRLQGICAGLLESHDAKYSSIAPDGKVLFMHRTVSDWIAKPGVWAALIAQTAGTGFSPSLALVKSCILQLKGLDVTPTRLFDMGLVADAVAYARDAEEELDAGFPKLFDQLDLAAAYQWRLGDCRAVHGVDNMSNAGSDTVDAQSDGSASPSGTPTQLTSYLQSYRASMMESQSDIFGTLDLDAQDSSSRPPAAGGSAPKNPLAASYIAHVETKFGGRTSREQQPQERTPPARKTVGTNHNHWSWCLEVPGLVPMHGAASFYDVARLAGMRHYVAIKDASANVLDQDVAQHLLMRAVAPPSGGVDPAVVSELLAGGTDPNFAYNAQTPWEVALAAAASHLASTHGRREDRLPPQHKTACENWIAVMGMFLRHDADPYVVAKVQGAGEDRPVVSICTLLESYAPRFLEEEAVALMELLVEKRAEVDRKQAGRTKRSPGVDIEGRTPAASVEWPMSWIPIRNSVV